MRFIYQLCGRRLRAMQYSYIPSRSFRRVQLSPDFSPIKLFINFFRAALAAVNHRKYTQEERKQLLAE